MVSAHLVQLFFTGVKKRTRIEHSNRGEMRTPKSGESMPVLKIVFDAEGILKDVPPEKIIHLKNSITVARLEKGMESGKASVSFIFELPDGNTVFAETSMSLFLAAASAFKSRFGDKIGE